MHTIVEQFPHVNAARLIDERAITEAPREMLPSIAAELARLTALLTLRLTTPTVEPEPDVLLDAAGAGALVNIKPTAMMRSAKFRSARRVFGPKTIRFSRAALLRIVRRAS